MDRQYLANLYTIENLTIRDIAYKTNIPKSTVHRLIVKYGLTKSTLSKATEIKRLYLQEEKSTENIASLLNCSVHCVNYHLKKLDALRTRSSAIALRSKNNLHNVDLFTKISSELSAYWLGFLYADGNLTKQLRRCTLSLAEKDKDHVVNFANLFNSSVKCFTHIVKGKSYNFCKVEVNNTYLCNQLFKLGIVPNKTANTTIRIFQSIPKQYMSHFLRGFMDGDGSIGISTDNQIRVSFCGNKKFITKLRSILITELNLTDNKLYKSKASPKLFSVEWQGNKKAMRILDWLYKDAKIFLPRKHDIYTKHKGVI